MPLPGGQLLFLSCLAFIAGIFFGNFFVAPPLVLFCLFLLSLFLLVVLLSSRKIVTDLSGIFAIIIQRSRIFRWLHLNSGMTLGGYYGMTVNICFLAFLFSCFFLFGWWRLTAALPDYSDALKIYGYASSTAEFTGRIVKLDQTSDSQKLTVKSDRLISAVALTGEKYQGRNVSGRVAVKTALYPEWQLGSEVKISCNLSQPGKIDDFDYAKYLRQNQVFVFCSLADVALAAEPPWYSFYGAAGRLKERLAQGINLSLPEPHASVIRGIVLGDGRGIPEHYNTVFANLGLTHIIAVSGSHLAVVFALVFAALLAMGIRRQKTFWPAAAIIAGYVVLVGAPASAVRSAIMILAALYAMSLGRLAAIKNVLAFTAALMLMVNPFTLLDDIGFQLSFASVLGLAYLLPLLDYQTRSWPEWGGAKEIIMVTISAQIATLPLILYYFGRLSLLSLPANLLILPIVPPLMIGGAAMAAAGAVFPLLGQIAGWPVWLGVQYWLAVSDFIHSLPLSSVALTGFGWPALLLSYALLIWLVWRQKKKYGTL